MTQTRVGWRSGSAAQPISSLWTSIYAVYNADATGSSSLNTSLYAAYNAESNANDSFGTNNGTAVGGLTYTTGKIGNAFQFNGTNAYVELGDVMDVGTSSWSYSMWFKTNDAVNNGICFSKSFAGGESGRFWGGYFNNRFSWNFQADTNVIYTETNNGSIVNNTWYHVVCILDRNDKLKLYINGSLQTLNVTSGTNNLIPYVSYNFNTNKPFRIGAYTDSDNTTATALINGQIDAFNVWNKVLTQSEITELYNSGNGAQYSSGSFFKPTTNDALNTYNGTPQGGLTYGVGKIETAFQFNGTNAYVALPDNSLNLNGDFSISLWWYVITTNDQSLISNMQKVGSNFYGWYLYYNSGWIYFYVCDGTTTFKQKGVEFNGLGGSANTWQHIVITKANSGPLKLYVNGTERTFSGTYNNENPSYSATQKCAIGNVWYGFYDSYVKSGSKIDSVNLWNKILTQTEITELYNSGNGKQYVPTTPSIVTNGLILNLDAGNSASYPETGTTWTDLSGQNNHGTLPLSVAPGPVWSSTNGGIFSFDGVNDYVGVPIINFGTSSVSWSFWIKPNRYVSTYESFIGQGLYSVNGGGMVVGSLRNDIGTKRIVFYITSDPQGVNSKVLSIDNAYTINTWMNITVTYNSSTRDLFMYINGVKQSVTTTVAGNFNNTSIQQSLTPTNTTGRKLSLGMYDESRMIGAFSGNISNTQIYFRTLSDTEVLNNFNATKTRFGL